MATPDDLIDLAYGFALSERLIDRAADICEVDVHPAENGTLLRIFPRTEAAQPRHSYGLRSGVVRA
ncbi:MAG: sulfurtransferase FdhD [Novosphingobium sp.]|nr:sulfurtransferase FdhD [Novosphingobium sp.]